MSRFTSLLSQNRVAGGAAVLAVTQLGASIAGLLRDRVLYQTFPELGITDIYYAAFRPSDLLFQVGIMSAIGTVLVPLLAQYRAKDDQVQVERLMGSTMTMGALLFGGLSIIFAVLMPWIAPYLVHFSGHELETYITFARLAFLTNFLFVFGNAAGQYLVTVQRYWIYGLTPILYTLGTILGTVFLTPEIGELGPMIGTVIGGVIFVLWRLLGMHMSGTKIRMALWHPDLHEMGILMLPRMLALGALQIQLLVFDAIGSGLDTGSITINAAARNFESVLVGVVGIAVAQSAYPLMSDALARKDFTRFGIYIKKGVTLLLALTLPGAIILSFAAPIAAWLVHLTHVLRTFSIALTIYAIAVPFESLNHLLLRAFYSMKNTLTPAAIGVLSGLMGIGIAYTGAKAFGMYGIAAGFVIGQIVQCALLSVQLRSTTKKLPQMPVTT